MNYFIVADNQDITRAGVVYLLQKTEFNNSVSAVPCKKELIEELNLHPQSVVVLDYTLFDFSTIEELLIVSARFKQAHWILFSEELSMAFLKRISLEESFSILLKSCSLEEINTALTETKNDLRYICPRVEQFISTFKINSTEEMQELTSTEKEILKLIAQGKSVKDIAEERFSSAHTIITHKKNIFRKLGVNSIYEATKYALRAGLVNTVEYYI